MEDHSNTTCRKEIIFLRISLCVQQQDYEQELLQRRFSGGSQSYGGDSPRLSPCSSMGKLSKSDEQLSSMEQDSGQCSRNTSCETLGKNTETNLRQRHRQLLAERTLTRHVKVQIKRYRSLYTLATLCEWDDVQCFGRDLLVSWP